MGLQPGGVCLILKVTQIRQPSCQSGRILEVHVSLMLALYPRVSQTVHVLPCSSSEGCALLVMQDVEVYL